jgi:hypothetical protein
MSRVLRAEAERSTIQFPYNDLDDAADLAKAFRLRVSNASTEGGITETLIGQTEPPRVCRRLQLLRRVEP